MSVKFSVQSECHPHVSFELKPWPEHPINQLELLYVYIFYDIYVVKSLFTLFIKSKNYTFYYLIYINSFVVGYAHIYLDCFSVTFLLFISF